jgi:hypothetical protein
MRVYLRNFETLDIVELDSGALFDSIVSLSLVCATDRDQGKQGSAGLAMIVRISP